MPETRRKSSSTAERSNRIQHFLPELASNIVDTQEEPPGEELPGKSAQSDSLHILSSNPKDENDWCSITSAHADTREIDSIRDVEITLMITREDSFLGAAIFPLDVRCNPRHNVKHIEDESFAREKLQIVS